MAGNRVDELEAKVRELEATIDGLTDELVETKERLQALESDADESYDVLDGGSDPTAEEPEAEPPADDGEASADDVNPEEADGEDNAGSESGDDIIVA